MPTRVLSKHLWGALGQGSSVGSQCLLRAPLEILPSLFQHRGSCEGHQGLCRKPSWGFRDSRATIRIGWPSSPQARLLRGRREGHLDEVCETDAFPGGFLLAGKIDERPKDHRFSELNLKVEKLSRVPRSWVSSVSILTKAGSLCPS